MRRAIQRSLESEAAEPEAELDTDQISYDQQQQQYYKTFNHHHQDQHHQEEEEQPRILAVLSQVLQRLVARNDICHDQWQCASEADAEAEAEAAIVTTTRTRSSSSSSSSIISCRRTVFHGVRAPAISIGKYMERIYKYTCCSPSCFVVGYVYMDRLIHRQPYFPLVSLTIHRLLLTSVMLAAKMLDDAHYNNAFYARVGGITNAELNRLELDLLFRLDFRLRVTAKVFESYCLHLEKEMLCKTEGQLRVDRILPGFSRMMTRIPSEPDILKEESTTKYTIRSDDWRSTDAS